MALAANSALQRYGLVRTWSSDLSSGRQFRAAPFIAEFLLGQEVSLEDLAVRAALLDADEVGYRHDLHWHGPEGPTLVASGEADEPRVDLERVFRRLLEKSPGTLDEYPFFTLDWSRPLPTPELPPVKVHLRHLPEGLLAVGMERKPR